MTRTLAFAAALIATTLNASADTKKTAGAKPCTYDEFMANCHGKGNVKACDWWWDKQQRMGGNCMR